MTSFKHIPGKNTNSHWLHDADSFFFHQHDFVTRDTNNINCFIIEKQSRVAATIYFSNFEKTAISLNMSPFGSINILEPLTEAEIHDLITYLVEWHKQQAIKQILITSFPECYDQQKFQLINSAYLDAGLTKKHTDTSQYLDLKQSDFSSLIRSSERRYLNHSKKRNYQFSQLTIDQLPDVYALIKESRKNKNYPVTLSQATLTKTIMSFPDRYKIFGLFDGQRLIAGSICVSVNKDVLYNFYNGDSIAYRKHSPVVALMAGIFKIATQSGYAILDLGISTDKGVMNNGLFSFKRNLGAKESIKPTYILQI